MEFLKCHKRDKCALKRPHTHTLETVTYKQIIQGTPHAQDDTECTEVHQEVGGS